ncbi:response regulator [Duganella sp. CY15W]|uniref:response regulator n=1 Tax=Duganella sp. CY15W TaxID=2692172 RepID=UPI001368EA9B|nr:response regulator [Duganella sp. CY15W]MYM30922.1 response regulator [Duganella sp. CY15W]
MLRTVASKMAALTVTALLGLVMVTAIGRYQMEKVYDGANFGNVNAAPSLVVLDEMRRSFLQLGVQISREVNSTDNGLSAESEQQIRAQRQAVIDAISKYDSNGCLGTNCYADGSDKSFLDKEKALWTRYDALLDPILAAARGGAADKTKADALLLATDPIADELHGLITKHIAYNVDVASDFTAKAVELKTEALYITLGIGAIMVLLIGGFGYGTARSIIRQLGSDPQDVAAVANRFATGDLSDRIELRAGDSTSVMASIKNMIATLERLASRAEAIGRGDLDQQVPLASEHDRLGKALNEMTRMLRASRDEDQRRNWLKDGYAELSAQLSGDLSAEQLADAAIAMVGRYLGAGRGVFYRYVESSQQLELIGSYMYTERNRTGASYALGEGAIGQVARERKPIILAVDEDTAPIVTGTVQQPPRHTYTYPMVHEKELVGVLEVASMQRFDERHIEFLNSVASMLSSLLFVADQRAHIRKLLLASEGAEREMRAQSEQLRTANNQMHEQQQQLQQQTEELQQNNAQLEEQQQQLQQQAEEMQQANAQMEEQQQQLRQQNDELQEARRLQEVRAQQLDQASRYKSEFLSNMSHELRTPLNSIILLSKMMCNDDTNSVQGEAAKWAQVIHRSGQDLLRLINDVLDLSKVEAGRMEIHLAHVQSADVCTELQNMFEHMARDKGLSLSVTDELQGSFVSDWDKLSQVLRNLLANAVKFTRQGGVSLTLSRRADPALPLRFSVRDTGIGIAHDKRSVIFEAFQQADGSTSREFGGTGLGLTISQRFVQMLGGRIELHSEPGQGSEFIILLPEAETGSTTPAAPGLALPADDRAQLGADDLLILLIDDDAAFSHSVVAMNRRLGYKTLLASTGEEGLRLAARHRPQGILLDLGLPDMDGAAVLHELKSDRALATIPVHIVSARDRDAALLNQGAIGFLQKPADDQLLEQAETALLSAVANARDGVLVCENGGITTVEVAAIIGNGHGPVQTAAHGEALEQQLRQRRWPLAVIDLGPSPATLQEGLALAARLRAANEQIALVFYALHHPGEEDSAALRRWSECVIVKTGQAERRLLENVERFLREVPQQRGLTGARAPAARDNKPLVGKHILVVDDDPRNLFVMTAALERHGAKISNAVNGRRALEQLRQQRVDLILMDIMMPELDGMQTIAALRADASLSSMPVVAISARAAQADMAEIMASGADDYLAKPVDYDVLIDKAIKWCGGRQP